MLYREIRDSERYLTENVRFPLPNEQVSLLMSGGPSLFYKACLYSV